MALAMGEISMSITAKLGIHWHDVRTRKHDRIAIRTKNFNWWPVWGLHVPPWETTLLRTTAPARKIGLRAPVLRKPSVMQCLFTTSIAAEFTLENGHSGFLGKQDGVPLFAEWPFSGASSLGTTENGHSWFLGHSWVPNEAVFWITECTLRLCNWISQKSRRTPQATSQATTEIGCQIS